LIAKKEITMKLKGSCLCGAVHFKMQSQAPVPYMRCYCTICRKTAGGGGYAINLGADSASLEVEGEEHISVFSATIDGEKSPAQRHFCSKCGSALWVYDPRWPELVHPFASAIDTPLPTPPENVHIMLQSKPSWVQIDAGIEPEGFEEYPDESLEQWHHRHKLLDKA